jgi:chemotaxis protein methyltransferase CheR
VERNLRDLLDEKDLLIGEMQHRIANNLQILASILLVNSRFVQSEEARLALQDAHRRVLSVAAVQQRLYVLSSHHTIDIARYLSDLCETLTQSMVGENRPISLTVQADSRTVPSRDVVSIGLIVSELVMNALKHAFPDDRTGAAIEVAYAVTETGWKLAVSDNGAGTSNTDASKHGLGTTLIQALAKQLDARADAISDCSGTTVSVTHGIVATPLPATEVKSGSGGIRRSPQ